MEKIFIMVNGLPGKMAWKIAQFAFINNHFELVPFSLTGQEIDQDTCAIETMDIELVRPDVRKNRIKEILARYPEFIAIDYTHPVAVISNARFYVENRIPFVMGTTGGDRKRLEQIVKAAPIPAVIAPNMAKQIVGFQAMMAFGAKTFPGLFKGYKMTVKESHQHGKADTSGTAKAMIEYFSELGIDFDVNEIEMERDPVIQEKQWGVPREFLTGHGWHTYALTAPDGSAMFEFKHNINGRDIYVSGTFDAALFLNKMAGLKAHTKKLFTMMDVLSGI